MNPIHISRRQLLAAAVIACVGVPPTLRAQGRSDATRILCGYPPGGSVDVVARKAVDKLTQLGAGPAVVDNRPGAAGRLALVELKKAAADGRTLVLTPASALTMYPHGYRDLAYDPFADLTPVCTLAATGFAFVVGPKVPQSVTDVDSFVRWCRADPARAQIGNAGAGSMPHFMAMLLSKESQLPVDHVPYRGGMLAMQAAAAGELSAALATEAAARPMADAGRLRVLATSGAERSSFFPQAPTFAQLRMPTLTQREWFGVYTTAGTPAAIVEGISAKLRTAMAEPDGRDLLNKVGLVTDALDSAQLAASMRREHAFWGTLVRSSGFKPES